MCPSAEDQPYDCRTCCCKSSDNVGFFHPDGAYEQECGARDNVVYKVSLVPTVDVTCHSDYPSLRSADFSGLLIVAHSGYLAFNRSVTEDSSLFEYIVDMDTVEPLLREHLEYEIEVGLIHDFFLPSDEPENCGDEERKRRIGYISVTPEERYVSVVSTLVSDYNIIIIPTLYYVKLCCICSWYTTDINTSVLISFIDKSALGWFQWAQPV